MNDDTSSEIKELQSEIGESSQENWKAADSELVGVWDRGINIQY